MTEEKTEFYRERSYQACVSTGWRILFDGYRSVLKFIWPQLAVAGIGLALAAYFVFVHYLLLTPEALCWVGVALLLYAVAASCVTAAAYVQIDFFRATGELPSRGSFSFMGNIRKRLWRSLAGVLTFVVLAALFLGSLYAAISLSAWWWIAVVLSVVLFVVIGLGMQFIQVERCSLSRAYSLMRREGVKSLGSWCLVQLTGWMAEWVCTAFFFLPAIVLSGNYFVSKVSVIIGDGQGIPAYAGWLYFLAVWLGTVGMHLSTLWSLWPRSLMVASIVRKAENREHQEAEVRQLLEEQKALEQ